MKKNLKKMSKSEFLVKDIPNFKFEDYKAKIEETIGYCQKELYRNYIKMRFYQRKAIEDKSFEKVLGETQSQINLDKEYLKYLLEIKEEGEKEVVGEMEENKQEE